MISVFRRFFDFGFVFKNVYLFQDTIANNIRFGQPDAPMKKVMEAAKKVCCHDFIMALSNGYDTVIGEGGAFRAALTSSLWSRAAFIAAS